MDILQCYYNGKRELEDIAIFHAEYEQIHPFQEGNGRTGRAIIFKQCLDSNIIPVVITNDDKMKYYHALHVAQVEKDYKELIEFFGEEQGKYWKNIERY